MIDGEKCGTKKHWLDKECVCDGNLVPNGVLGLCICTDLIMIPFENSCVCPHAMMAIN
jgi:hypothetical protein